MSKLNRHARKRQHKRELKKNHAFRTGVFSVQLDEENQKSNAEEFPDSKYVDHRNGGYQYWHRCYLSGSRGYAKFCTNRKIRSMFRDLIATGELSEIVAPQGSDYEKLYDYFWTIW